MSKLHYHGLWERKLIESLTGIERESYSKWRMQRPCRSVLICAQPLAHQLSCLLLSRFAKIARADSGQHPDGQVSYARKMFPPASSLQNFDAGRVDAAR